MLYGNEYVDLSKSYIERLSTNSTSKGNQEKYYNHDTNEYIKLQFFYDGKYWMDPLVERMSSRLATMMGLPEDKVVRQRVVMTNKKLYASVSKDFMKPDEDWIPAIKIMKSAGKWPVSSMLIPDKEFNRICTSFNKVCNVDISEYIVNMSVIDFLLLNVDRHYNNFGIIKTQDGYQISPLFDFGLGLFEHDRMYENMSLRTAISKSDFKPLSNKPFSVMFYLLKSQYRGYIINMVSKVRIPPRELFPNDQGYRWFQYALWTILEESNEAK
jgi:hypothetical protein